MGSLFRFGAGLALVAGTLLPASAQAERCTQDALNVEGSPVAATFCVAAGSGPPAVSVSETFRSHGQSVSHSVSLPVVAGAQVSRTIDDVDLSPLGIKRSLHMTLAYSGGAVELEHALALPGATPVK